MGRNFVVAVALMLFGMVVASQAFSVYKPESYGLQHLSRRVERSTDKQFLCVLPNNQTENNPYIHCGIINETRIQYRIPVDLNDRYRPKFESALLCSNLTIVEDEEEVEDGDEDDDRSSSSSEEDSEESEEDPCLRRASHDCSMQCVYRESNVLNEIGLPEADPLYEHIMQLLNQDGEFKRPVKEAVKSCHKQMVDIVHKYGLERLNMCRLIEVVNECLEIEIPLHCPKLRRIPFKKS